MIMISILILLSYIIFCKYHKYYLQYWRRRCVTYSKPHILFGNFLSVVFRKTSYSNKIKDLYDEFPQERYNGVFEINQPKLLVRDPKLVENIFLKKFEYFANRRHCDVSKIDDNLGRSLYFLNYDQWKRVRPCVEKNFEKNPIESLFSTISSSSESLTNCLLEETFRKKKPINFEATDLFRRITNDVIAAVVFGHDCNSLLDKENEFYQMSRNFLKTETTTSLKFFLYDTFPILKIFLSSITLYPKDALKYFENLIFSENSKNSLFSHLTKSYKNNETELSKEDIMAQVVSFFNVGFEPLAATMSFLAYELALNMQIQKKIEMEIDKVQYANNADETISFESFSKISLLDAVILETLRKWPSAVKIERICTKDYILRVKSPKECAIRVEKGDSILIPVYGFHHDNKHFPHPEKFDPDRFLNKNLDELMSSCNFFPFGMGPRRCLVVDLGILIIKTVFFEIISKFEINLAKKTEIPLKISTTTTHLTSQNGIHLVLKPRK